MTKWSKIKGLHYKVSELFTRIYWINSEGDGELGHLCLLFMVFYLYNPQRSAIDWESYLN